MENISSKGEQTQIGYTSEIRTSGIPFGLSDGTMVTDRWTPLRSITIETDSLAATAHTAEGLRVHGLLSYGAAMGASWHLLGHLDDPSVEIRVVRHKLTTTWKVEEEGIVEMSPLVLPIRPETKPRS